jgi:hypothetical protein
MPPNGAIRAVGVIPIEATRLNVRAIPTRKQRGDLINPIRGPIQRREFANSRETPISIGHLETAPADV